MKHLPYAIAPLALAISPFTLAADAEKTPTEIVITADRSLTPVTEHLDAATVITRQDIERQQAASVADLISQSTGISLPATGGPLNQTGVFLRGFDSRQILVLIDGIRANDATSGGFDFSIIRPEDVERIEVLRGGYSSQYGSDAMGGVIQIFTRKQADNSIALRAGSFKTREETLTLGERGSRGGANVSYTQYDTAGFNAGDKNYAAVNFATPNPDKNGGDQRTLRVSGDHEAGGNGRISGQSILKDGNTSYDNGSTQQTFALGGLQYEYQASDSSKYQVGIGYLRNKQDTLDTSYGPSFYAIDTQRYNLDLTSTLKHDLLGTTTAGATLIQEAVYVSADYLPSPVSQRLNNNAVFLLNEKNIGAFSYRLSGRHDHHETWGDHDTGSLRAGYQLSPHLQAFAGYGTNFRAPTANDLYTASGNINLQPETSRQKDIGLIWRVAPQHQLKLTGYQADVQGLISGFPPVNVNHARLKGLELDASGQFGDTGYQLGVLRAQVDSDVAAAHLRRPRAQLTGDIHHRITGRITVGTQLVSRSNTPDVGGATQGFAVFNAYATWSATPKLQLGLRFDNLADKTYEAVRGYSTPGRSAYVTLRYRF